MDIVETRKVIFNRGMPSQSESTLRQPMMCCGLLEAEDIDGSTEEFYKIKEAQINYKRSCALITLAEYQRNALRVAKENEFKVIAEFYNPNSERMNYILARIEFNSELEYKEKGWDNEV